MLEDAVQLFVPLNSILRKPPINDYTQQPTISGSLSGEELGEEAQPLGEHGGSTKSSFWWRY